MNLKTIIYSILCSQILLLTACIDLRPWEYKPKNYIEFQDARGGGVSVCGQNAIMDKTNGEHYLKSHGLPIEIQGNFICENGKPALPKDCQGKEFRSENELRVYWEKHQLPVGLIRFECKNGVPSVQPHAIPFWQKVERTLGGSCKDTQGKPRYCI